MVRAVGFLLLLPSLAIAQPPSLTPGTAGVEESEAPPPVLMAELTARSRLNLSLLGSTIVFANLGQISVYASHAFDNLEVGGEIRVRGLLSFPEGRSDSDGDAGNLALKTRYNIHVDQLTISPALTLWAPITSADQMHWDLLTRMAGVDDARGYLDEGALGVALAAAYRTDCSFVQAELGAALVRDNGPQVASVFAAAGAGKAYSDTTSFMVEWRSEWFPIDDRVMGVGLAMLRKTSGAMMRFRVHPYVLVDDSWGGFAFGLDVLWRFR